MNDNLISFQGGIRSSKPLHAEIRAELSRRIEQSVYSTDSALPSASALASEFGVSLITVKRAIKDLQNEGILISRAGLGTFVKRTKRFVRDYSVSLNSMDDAERLGFDMRIELLSIMKEDPRSVLANAPDAPFGTMRCIKKAVYVDDTPIMYDISFVSQDLGEEFFELLGDHLISDAMKMFGIKLKRTELVVEATPAAPETQIVCSVPIGYPCLLRRYHYETNRNGLIVFGQIESPFDKLSCTLSTDS